MAAEVLDFSDTPDYLIGRTTRAGVYLPTSQLFHTVVTGLRNQKAAAFTAAREPVIRAYASKSEVPPARQGSYIELLSDTVQETHEFLAGHELLADFESIDLAASGIMYVVHQERTARLAAADQLYGEMTGRPAKQDGSYEDGIIERIAGAQHVAATAQDVARSFVREDSWVIDTHVRTKNASPEYALPAARAVLDVMIPAQTEMERLSLQLALRAAGC